MAQAIPSGTITFLLTDIEGSKKKWEQHPYSMRSALKQNRSKNAHNSFLENGF